MRSLSGVPALALCAATVLAAAPAAYALDLTGTPGDDTIVGTEAADRIAGRAGADSLSGLGGNDTLFGEAGADVLDAGDGADVLNGGGGPDVLKGGNGSDTTTVGPGDTVWAGADRDRFRTAAAGDWLLHGGPGDDLLDVQVGGVHTVYGDDGDDVLGIGTLGDPASRAFGGEGADQVLAAERVGGPLTRVALLSGGPGDDAVFGHAVTLDGGAGNDEISSTERSGEPFVSAIRCGDGVDRLVMDKQPTGPLDSFGADCESINVQTFAPSDADATIVGTRYNDRIQTWDGNDTVSAAAGDDEVYTSWGSDVVDLGAGDDYYENWPTHEFGVDVDEVTCGPGADVVYVYRTDVVDADCETVNYR